MAAESSSTPPRSRVKPKRRWFQFSLWTLLVTTFFIALALGMLAHRRTQIAWEKAAIANLERLGRVDRLNTYASNVQVFTYWQVDPHTKGPEHTVRRRGNDRQSANYFWPHSSSSPAGYLDAVQLDNRRYTNYWPLGRQDPRATTHDKSPADKSSARPSTEDAIVRYNLKVDLPNVLVDDPFGDPPQPLSKLLSIDSEQEVELTPTQDAETLPPRLRQSVPSIGSDDLITGPENAASVEPAKPLPPDDPFGDGETPSTPIISSAPTVDDPFQVTDTPPTTTADGAQFRRKQFRQQENEVKLENDVLEPICGNGSPGIVISCGRGLPNGNDSDTSWTARLGIKSLPPIGVVTLNNAKQDADVAPLADLSGVRELHLYKCDITDQAMRYVARIPHLKHLSMENVAITDEGIRKLVKSRELQEVTIRSSKITDASLPHLAALPDLRLLNVMDSNVTNDGLKSLRHAKKLQGLVLVGTQVTSSGIAQLPPLPELRELCLDERQVRYPGLTNLARFPRLETLMLHAPITNDLLSQLRGLKQLKRLWLYGHSFTKEETTRLIETVPHCFIMTEPK